jgi:hypothetical protein
MPLESLKTDDEGILIVRSDIDDEENDASSKPQEDIFAFAER